jgi:tetratricopeptide (TPR) repeat protein
MNKINRHIENCAYKFISLGAILNLYDYKKYFFYNRALFIIQASKLTNLLGFSFSCTTLVIAENEWAWYFLSMRMPPRRISIVSVFALAVFFLLCGCEKVDSYYFSNNYELDAKLSSMMMKLVDEDDEIRFVLIREISNMFLKTNQRNKQIYFLTKWAEKHPFDPYDSYYLMLVAQSYEELGAIPFALYYYERIIKNHPNLYMSGTNIHYQVLKKLIQCTDDSELKIEFYKILISQYEDHLEDVGSVYFSLAKTYEEVGDLPQAMQTYEKFIKLPHTQIQGLPDAYKKIEEKIDFYNSDYRKWTFDDLDFLVEEVKDAILSKNSAKLERYKAKAGFFTMYWEQQNFDETRSRFFDIQSFLRVSEVNVDARLDIDSNANEAYLKTTNWAYRETTWYFYFKKINFPADPNINGRWEWAGIYFGKKL